MTCKGEAVKNMATKEVWAACAKEMGGGAKGGSTTAATVEDDGAEGDDDTPKKGKKGKKMWKKKMVITCSVYSITMLFLLFYAIFLFLSSVIVYARLRMEKTESCKYPCYHNKYLDLQRIFSFFLRYVRLAWRRWKI